MQLHCHRDTTQLSHAQSSSQKITPESLKQSAFLLLQCTLRRLVRYHAFKSFAWSVLDYMDTSKIMEAIERGARELQMNGRIIRFQSTHIANLSCSPGNETQGQAILQGNFVTLLLLGLMIQDLHLSTLPGTYSFSQIPAFLRPKLDHFTSANHKHYP